MGKVELFEGKAAHSIGVTIARTSLGVEGRFPQKSIDEEQFEKYTTEDRATGKSLCLGGEKDRDRDRGGIKTQRSFWIRIILQVL